tara:strand:+ start:147 stop:323 length:177 start_codon:yes stop_codon:yes gene_type:complete
MILKKHPKYPMHTRFDKLAKKLYMHSVPRKIQLRLWDNLNLKLKDYWRGLAQITMDKL